MYSKEAESYVMGKGVNEGRIVLHSDLNNFFASVECLKHRELSAYPVAVCGSSEQRHGIVLAKNNIAKKYGVKTGQAIWQAKQLCPGMIVLEPHHEEYLYYSEKVRRIYQKYSDRVEPFGMDEAWIELTGIQGVKSLSDGVKTANSIRREIYESTGLTVSVGVSDNKTFAKLASDYRKPDAVTVFGPQQYSDKICPLPIGELMYAGRSTQKRLKSFCVETIGDAANTEISLFKSILGKNGVSLYMNACGHDTSAVQKTTDKPLIKSLGNSQTPPRDIVSKQDRKIMIYSLCDKVAARLRKAGLMATVVQLQVKDTNFKVSEAQRTIFPTDNAGTLASEALELFKDNFSESIALRALGVRTCGLVAREQNYQHSLFEKSQKETEKMYSLDEAIDDIHLRFGNSAITRAVLYSDKTLYRPSLSSEHSIQPFLSH